MKHIIQSDFTDQDHPWLELLDATYEYCYLESMHYLNSTERIRILVTGLSYALDGVHCPYLTEPAINLAMASQDLYYDSLNIRRAVSAGKGNIKNCVITLSYYSLFYDLSRSNNKVKCYTTYRPLFGDTHHAQLDMPFLPSRLTDPDFISFYRGWFLRERTFFGKLVRRLENNPYEDGIPWYELDIETRREKAAFEAEHQNHFQVYRETLDENLQIVNELINFLKEKNISVYVVVLPFTGYYMEVIDPELRNTIDRVLEGLPGVVDFLDMNELSGIFDDSEDFKDATHLNYNGMIKCTSVINMLLEGDI